VEAGPGYVPVLAVLTMKITPDTTKRIGTAFREVMEERFLLNGIYGLGADFCIGFCIQNTLFIPADSADAMMSFPDNTAVAAQGAFHGIVRKGLVLACFMHGYARSWIAFTDHEGMGRSPVLSVETNPVSRVHGIRNGVITAGKNFLTNPSVPG
jgi:hypothetical protein